jgi:hypothetical protein
MLSAYLETIWVLVARPPSRIRVEDKPLFVFFGDIVVQVLSQGKLAVELKDG